MTDLKKTWLAVLSTAIFTALFTAASLCAGAAYLAGCFFIDLALKRGTSDNPDAPPAIFRSAIEGNGRAIRPAPKPNFDAESWTLRSFDGLTLRATHFEPEQDSRRWVLILHGYGLTQAHVWSYATAYLAHGYHVVTPDLRASGSSDGVYTTMGALEARDAADWARRITSADPEARIVLHGVSMGAAAVMLAAGENRLPTNVAAVVEDSGYANIYDLFAIELDKLLSLPAYPLLDAADLVCEHRAGFSFRKAAPVEALRRSRLPILFIHGTADRLVPFTMMQTLYDASPSPAKEKLVIEKIGHGALYQAKNYFPKVFAFTDKWTE